MNKNIKKRIISSILAVTMSISMTGCSKNNKNNTGLKQIDNISTTEVTIPTIEETEPIIETTIPTIEETESIIETTIPSTSINNSSNKVDLENYMNAVNTIEVDYEHQKYYPTQKDIFNFIAKASSTVTKCDNQFNGDITSIINKLIENSVNFINENPKYKSPFPVINNCDEDLLLIQNYFETAINNILNNWLNNSNNINEDFCTLENYKIVFSFDQEENKDALAYTTNGCVVIFPNRIKEFAINYDCNFYELFEQIINHEFDHIRQTACKCKIYKGQSYFDIDNSTLIEASAVSYTNYKNNTIENTYKYLYIEERGYEALLLTLGLFHDDMTIDNYYNAIFDSNLEEFHKFFNAYTEEEINNLYNIFYAINAINLRNDLFLNYYDVGTELSLKEINKFIGYDYRIDIFKLILKNMMQYTSNHNDFTLNDNLAMFNIMKSLIVKDAYEIVETGNPNNPYTYIYDEDFVISIYDLESKYIEFLSENYNVSVQNIRELEEYEISLLTYAISMYCHDDYTDIDYKYYEHAKNLVDKFPLLKSILSMHYTASYHYENFVENTNKTLTRTN